MGTSRDSTLYGNLYSTTGSKLLGDARDRGGRLFPLGFAHTVVSGEASGDTVNLCVIPAFWEVIDLLFNADAQATLTIQLGDAGNAARYMAATVFNDGGGNPVLAGTGLNKAACGFRPTADTIVLATWAAAAPTVGKTLWGKFICIPPA